MKENMIRREIRIEAKRERLDELLDIVRTDMEEKGCPVEKQISVEICAEEIFVNIASYAYEDTNGEAWITEEVTDTGILLCFKDQGIPYNPLAKEDPDITLAAEDRKIGGLGIYMVKNMMDSVSYEYADGKNCLTIGMTW